MSEQLLDHCWLAMAQAVFGQLRPFCQPGRPIEYSRGIKKCGDDVSTRLHCGCPAGWGLKVLVVAAEAALALQCSIVCCQSQSTQLPQLFLLPEPVLGGGLAVQTA